ncbi:RhoGAP-domain-containing protein [Testicularia cyperi]|uniref:RhoGAP-domain-containing protein n=1 Tax=Testicularia cyperi TaxID=1882483 RepID=A0A317XZM3_9BASI|nr:RhoGAP-domain-containing protein [Testicularia cyperi]
MPALVHEHNLPSSDGQLHENAEIDATQQNDFDEELPEAYCGGCGLLIDEESVEEGVIQFATKLWHVECFRCAKCKNRVSTERDDILLLSDGHPICGECNYSCNICNLPIMEEAIMTGDESYHASCFTCRSCHSKIEELVFAKTSQGIYCMKCHNDRVARSRKHAEQKRAKARREKHLHELATAPTGEKPLPSSGSSSAANTAAPASGMASRDASVSPRLPESGSNNAPPSSSGTHNPAPSNPNSTLSPWLNGSGPSVSRPGSSNGRRPFNAPPPPSREGRSPASLNQKLPSPDGRQNLSSRNSLSSIASNTRDDAYDAASLSPRKKTFGLPSPVSRDAPPASPQAKSSFNNDDASNPPSLPSSPRKATTSLAASYFSSGSEPSYDSPLNASASSSRMSKVYSFYDPDFLNLVESFGQSESREEFTAPPPLPTSRHQVESAAANGTASALPDSAVAIEGDEELLQDDRRNSAGSLKSLSKKMRASIQQARNGQVSMDLSFIEGVLRELEQTRERMETLQFKYDRIRRASQQAAQGFSMAKEEFEHEVNARHEAELEMARLKRQLAEQALKLASANSEKRQQEQLERRSQDVKASLQGMERDLAKLTVERDLTVAEVAELVSLQDGSAVSSANLITADSAITKSLATRLEAVKARYRKDIDELTLERDALLIEIEELKQSKDLFLEEAQSLNAKNDELNAVLAQLNRKVELASQAANAREQLPPLPRYNKDLPQQLGQQHQHQSSTSSSKGAGAFGFGSRTRPIQKNTIGTPSISSHDNAPNSAGLDSISVDTAVQQVIKPEKIEPAPVVKKFKWMKPKLSDTSKANILLSNVPPVPPKAGGVVGSTTALVAGGPNGMTRATSNDLVVREHLFQPYNVLRPTRCLACQKNMWGQSEMRCSLCTQVCHSRCLQSLSFSCNQPYARPEDAQLEPAGPSMFGRELTEQASQESRDVPMIVEKCIQAVEAFGMDYEGIYRKSGGTSQLKVITQLFERGSAFDLEDTDRFNDVSAITSVLKNYFRELPTPLLTFDLYDDFIRVVESKQDTAAKASQMKELVARLPRQHNLTLKHLVLHLNRVQEQSAENRMNARNLGVVFGPTLMRSPDPAQEFAHMGGKAMTIEYCIENARDLFV